MLGELQAERVLIRPEGRCTRSRQEWESGGPFPTRDRTVLGLDSRVGERTRALARDIYATAGFMSQDRTKPDG